MTSDWSCEKEVIDVHCEECTLAWEPERGRMVRDFVSANPDNGVREMSLPVSTRLGVAIEGLDEATHRTMVFVSPVLWSQLVRDFDPGLMLRLQVRLYVGATKASLA